MRQHSEELLGTKRVFPLMPHAERMKLIMKPLPVANIIKVTYFSAGYGLKYVGMISERAALSGSVENCIIR